MQALSDPWATPQKRHLQFFLNFVAPYVSISTTSQPSSWRLGQHGGRHTIGGSLTRSRREFCIRQQNGRYSCLFESGLIALSTT